ncbi:protein kinase [Streptomyces sp. TG1A-60]|uniref:protein kinase domain-containing protein n=1 Tax=Streptomyces sp. TG1A-60 TaxID=3129111 RepID=UPI0030CD2253
MSDQRPAPPCTPASGEAALEQAGATPLRPADPAHIGPYAPLGLLGSGGMGRVYLARPADDRPGLAAVKVIRPEYAEDAEFRRRFEREATVHGRVRTPYAPQLLGTGFDDELLWMATEYLPGLNLADAVHDCGRLEPVGMWRLVTELGRALAALTAAGVVHRDLKPSNVILSSRGAHVIDFGISQAVDSSAITTTGSRVGTPAYMSPEYLRDGRCDSASDVFSLACALVYAATGHAPFGDGTGVDVMHRVAFEEPKPEIMAEVAAADPALGALLTACLAKDPSGRPTSQQLIDTATASGYGPGPASTWQEPLGARLLERRQACEELAHATTQQTGHFRTPTQRVAAPTPGPAFGPPTPPGAYGSPTPPDQHGTAPAPGQAPVPDGTIQGSQAKKKRKKSYLAALAGSAVCAVAVSAFLVTGPLFDDTASSSPMTAETTASGDGTASPSPDSSPSSSPTSTDKERQEKDEAEKEAGGQTEDDERQGGSSGSSGGDAGVRPPTATVTATSGTGTGTGTGTAPSAAPTKSATPPADPPWITQCTYYSGAELTRYGDKNRRVTQVQCMLVKRGYGIGSAGVDGQFGTDTLSAVKRFQGDKGLSVDGDVGPDTWRALRGST